VPNPSSENTFRSSKLDWSEAEAHAPALALHRDLIRLRREDPVLSSPDAYRFDGATVTESAFLLRWFADDDTDRLLIVNMDRQVEFDSIPEPIVAPPRDKDWTLLWCSEDARYGGHGIIMPLEAGGRGRA